MSKNTVTNRTKVERERNKTVCKREFIEKAGQLSLEERDYLAVVLAGLIREQAAQDAGG